MPDQEYYQKALLIGARIGVTSAIETSLQNGADINTRNSDKQTAYMVACKNGHLVAVTLLVEKKADITLLDKNGRTGKMLAREAGHEEIVDYIEKVEKQRLTVSKKFARNKK